MINGQTTARNQIEGWKGCSELAARLESGRTPIVLNLREEHEYAAGHIPGAILVPIESIESGPLAGGMSEWTGPIEK